MKKLSTFFFVLAYIIISFTSCEQNSINEITNYESGVVNFKYKGVRYTSNYSMVGKNIIYDNKDVEELLNILKENPTLATLIDSNDNIEFFDSYDELYASIPHAEGQNKLNTEQSYSNVTTRGPKPPAAILKIYVNVKYKGSSKTFIADPPGWWGFEDLSVIGFCNNISSYHLNASIGVIGNNRATFTLWDQKKYTGHSVSWWVDRDQLSQNVSYLGSYLRTLPPLIRLTWNDAAQSMKFGF